MCHETDDAEDNLVHDGSFDIAIIFAAVNRNAQSRFIFRECFFNEGFLIWDQVTKFSRKLC